MLIKESSSCSECCFHPWNWIFRASKNRFPPANLKQNQSVSWVEIMECTVLPNKNIVTKWTTGLSCCLPESCILNIVVRLRTHFQANHQTSMSRCWWSSNKKTTKKRSFCMSETSHFFVLRSGNYLPARLVTDRAFYWQIIVSPFFLAACKIVR